ncbi:MAG: hypothetical protein WC004_04515 [Candidatus Absconditabacterales bacterium]
MYQKSLFALFVIVTLTVQGCSMAPKTTTETPDTAAVTTTGTEETTTPTPDTTGTTTTASTLNGTFKFADKYMTPGGEEPMDVTVTIVDGVITAVEAKNVAILPKSVSFQDKFIAGVAGVVVGKNVSDVEITNINGSSLTAQAFNKALNNLELQ